MLNNLKALVVILALAWLVFRVARPICLQYMAPEAFARRRNIWFALTIVAFVSPSFWIYGLFALILLYWAAAQDENPLALYVLVTFAIPGASFYIPGFIVNQLFDLTQYRILSLVIVIPSIVRHWNNPAHSTGRGLKPADLFLLAFLALQVVLLMPYESVTAAMRRAFLATIDTFVVFYAFSRLHEREKLSEVMACFWLAGAVMALVAIFEWAKGWLLYTGLASLWGDPNEFSWLLRGGSLRAQAAANHSINLGYVLAVALGFFFYLRGRLGRAALGWLVAGAFCVAIFVTGSRAAWLTAFLVAALFALFRPHAARRLAGAAAVGTLLVAVMYVTPLKESVLDRLPVIGNTDQDTVVYRQQVAEVSWMLIRQNPFFGDPFVARHMGSLRQGQGLIDIVNGYIFTALFNGLVGLFLQLSVFAIALWKASAALLRTRGVDADSGLQGASLVATFVASLFFIATAGYGTTTYIIAGLLVSYATAAARLPAAADSPLAFAPADLRHRGAA